jgi:hypothetical protein
MPSKSSTRASYRAPNRPAPRAPRTLVARNSHQRGNKFQRRATGTSGQIVFSDAMSEFNNEIVIRRENPHRLYEFLFFIHFHRDDYAEGGGTTAVLP